MTDLMDCICSPKVKMRLALRNDSFTYSASVYRDSCFVLDTASSVVDFSLKKGHFSGGPGAQIQSLVVELRFHMPHNQKEKEVNSPPSGAIQFRWEIEMNRMAQVAGR